MRRSLKDLNASMVRKDNYPGLPDILKEYNYWLADAGHSIMAIPECLLKEAEESGEMWRHEVPFPVRYVMEMGFRKHGDYIVCDGVYDAEFGLMVPEEYCEY